VAGNSKEIKAALGCLCAKLEDTWLLSLVQRVTDPKGY